MTHTESPQSWTVSSSLLGKACPWLTRNDSSISGAADVQARIDELADKCNEGQLTDAERDEYDDYLQAIHLIGILQRKAKRVLANGTDP